MHSLLKIAPLFIAIAVLTVIVAIILDKSLIRTGGHLIYALDDPYIHMAMAKNFARYGVWGVTRYEFTSSTSAPLWTFLLAITYFIFHVNDLAPFLLAFSSAVLLLVFAFWMCRQEHLGKLATTLLLVGLVLSTPLATLVFVGLEHALHLLFTLLVAYLASRVLSRDASPIMSALLVALLPFLILSRYEGLFLAGAIISLLLVRRMWTMGAVFLGLAVLPVWAYGAISVANGWNWLPNSILVKSALPPNPQAFFANMWTQLVTVPALGGLLVLAVILFLLNSRGRVWTSSNLMLVLFFLTSLFHLAFARVGWFYRYEAYLIGLGWTACALTLFDLLPRLKNADLLRQVSVAFILLLAVGGASFTLAARALVAMRSIPQASQNIYEQQYQAARFVFRYYSGATIIANDIGAISYFADVRIIDVVGLATRYTAERQMAHIALDGDELAAYASSQGVQIAFLYDSLYTANGKNHLPGQWNRISRWTIQNNIAAGDPTVSIYAVDETGIEQLRAHLQEFSTILPPTVSQQGEGLP